jgi:hypothetical protein
MAQSAKRIAYQLDETEHGGMKRRHGETETQRKGGKGLGRVIHHGDTEDTEEMNFSLAGRRRPGKRASAFGGSSFSSRPTIVMRSLVPKNLPGGLSSLARSSSPDRAKTKFALCSLCLCGSIEQ